MATVPIHLSPTADRRYDVVIGSGLLADLGSRVVSALKDRPARAFIVADAGLPGGVIDAARGSLEGAGLSVHAELIAPTESIKTLDTIAHLLGHLTSTRHERRDPVIALGGGIVGDVAGFVAAIYRRGVPIIQCPTTLLAMVDASVGGKTGVNMAALHGAGEAESLKKNLVGAFWQPSLVLADLAALDSLSERHFRAGLAECLKHGLISRAVDPDLFAWMRANLAAITGRDAATLASLVERNVRVKASFVVDDEREEKPSDQGGRALLNLGHTFGHAIETLPQVSPDDDPANAPLHHGEAVGLGLVAAAATSAAMGLLGAGDAAAVRSAVESAGLPTRVRGLPPDEAILAAMAHDKKVLGGRLRLVLPVSIGEARVIENPPRAAVVAGIEAIRG
jgi:3-dehydroquinate synthase